MTVEVALAVRAVKLIYLSTIDGVRRAGQLVRQLSVSEAERLLEQHHDELGLRWPSSVSPFDVHVVIANKDEAARAGAADLAETLDRLGVDVLLDDRQASPGVKFKDAELLGVPWIVVVGRGWADGIVELRNRFSGETQRIGIDNAAADIAAALAS